MIVFLYLQFWFTRNPPNLKGHVSPDGSPLDSEDPKFVLYGKYFLTIEILTFYGQVFNIVIYLLYIQLRGQFGFKNYKANKDRYKFDALTYYQDDVQWQSFQFVPLLYKLNSFVDRTKAHDENFLRSTILWFIIAGNLVAVFLVQPLNDQHRKLRQHTWKSWVVVYIGLIVAWCLKVFVDPQWDKTLFLLVLDTGILLLQTLLYYVSLAHQDNPFESAVLKWKIWRLLVGYIPPIFGPKRKTDSKTFKDEPLVIQNDSYSLAYAALIHPEVAAKHKKSDAHMPSIKLLNEERESIFTGAMMITMF